MHGINQVKKGDKRGMTYIVLKLVGIEIYLEFE